MGTQAVRTQVRVSSERIDPDAHRDWVADPTAGAIVQFLGTVRDHSPGKTDVSHLTYEAYQEEVEGSITEIVDEATDKWELIALSVEHRVGDVQLSEPSVSVTVSSVHRAEAFEAARFVIDELKVRAPIWKKEHWPEGAEWAPGA
ncbi:MAG: molybdenum cofactor biosynthesis protein MoaE [Acidimicrobiia bacterium]